MADDLDDQLEYSIADSPTEENGSSEMLDIKKVPMTSQPKKSKRSKKDPKLIAKKKTRMQEEANKKKLLGEQQPAVIADYVVAKIRLANPDLSGLEIQDHSVSESNFIDTSNFGQPRELTNIPRLFLDYGLDKPLGEGELVVVLCHSALRACHVRNVLQAEAKVDVIKLIQKNNPTYDRKALTSKRFIAVSTPGRIRKLIGLGELDPKRVSRIVLDSAFLDQKNSNVWDLAETIPLLSEISKHNASIYVF